MASLRKDGSPFIVPLGFQWTGEHLHLSIRSGRTGVTRLRRAPSISVMVVARCHAVEENELYLGFNKAGSFADEVGDSLSLASIAV